MVWACPGRSRSGAGPETDWPRLLVMASTNSRKAKRDTSDVPRRLTRSEIASLRRDMKESSDWADRELERRYAQKEAKARSGRKQARPWNRITGKPLLATYWPNTNRPTASRIAWSISFRRSEWTLRRFSEMIGLVGAENRVYGKLGLLEAILIMGMA